jgi:hypothetical protein
MTHGAGSGVVGAVGTASGTGTARGVGAWSRELEYQSFVIGILLTFTGASVWQFKHVRGIGNGFFTTGMAIILFVGLRAAFRWMKRQPAQSIWRRFLRLIRYEGGAISC